MKQDIKIYFPESEGCKSLEELLNQLFSYSDNLYSVATYCDKDFFEIQCLERTRRSFEDLMCIANTYFPGTTEVELMEAMYNIKLKFYSCYDIKKIVFHRAGGANISLYDNLFSGEINESECAKNTYTKKELTEILNELIIKLKNKENESTIVM